MSRKNLLGMTSEIGQENAVNEVKFMATKSILLAIADQQAAADISQALGPGWMPTPVRTETEALVHLERYSFDAILVDFNLGSPDASELLNRALEKRPEATRFLLAYEADLALVAAKVQGEHQILPKPIEFASLRNRLEEGVAPQKSKGRQTGSDPAGGLEASPKIPEVYDKVLKALESPDATTAQVGQAIGEDDELTAEVLRLANSTYLGSRRNVSDPVEAVGSLGPQAVKALVMTLRFLAEHSHLRPGYLSFDKLWQHSTNVALIARDLVLFETKDRALASEAFVAGLVHDLGKVVLVTNFDDLYGRVHSLARKQPVPIWEAEKEMFGANHGEIGGCLVGMWNLPLSVVDAAALHHEPPLGENDGLTPLAAVHIANVLEHGLAESNEFRVAPIIDTRYLNELGLLQRLPVWRAAVANGNLAEAELELAPAEASQTDSGDLTLTSATETSTITRLPGIDSGNARSAVSAAHWQRRWVYAGVAAALLLLLTVLWLGTRPQLNQSVSAYARTPGVAPVNVSSAQTHETLSVAAPQNARHTTVSEETREMSVPISAPPLYIAESKPTSASSTKEASSTNAPTVSAALSVPERAPASATATVTNIVSVARPENTAPEFRLNGIIYTAARPSAIVNGQTVHVGDQVNGSVVLGIGVDRVIMLSNGQLKTYSLRK